MARVDQEPEDRDQTLLVLEQFVDCEFCGLLQDVIFPTPEGTYELEDLTEAPTTLVHCEGCGLEFEVTYSAWTIHDEA